VSAQPLSSKAKANVALVIETMYAVAAHPDRWDQIIDALDGAPADAPHRALDASRLARLAVDRPEPMVGQVGVVMISAAGGVVAWNGAGEAVFHQRLGAIEAHGVAFFNPSNHEAFDQARVRLRGAPGRQVIVKFSQIADEAPHFAYVVAAQDLPIGLSAGLQRVDGRQDGALAIVFPAVEATDRLWANLRESFGLTPAETRLAARLKDGLTLKEASGELGVTINTVRNQLRAIFEKVGLSRQSDLIRALTQLSSLAGSLEGSLGDHRALGALGPAIAATERGAVQNAPPLQVFRLADGRRLTWRQYGDPEGKPVMIVHQGLGCSVLPRGTDALARDLRLRLICPERPGAGRSDPLPHFSYDGVARDMAALVTDLGLERVQIASFMAGAPFALVAAAQLGPRVHRVLLASARPSGVMAETDQDIGHKVVLFRRRILRNAWVADMLFTMMRLQLNARQVERFVRAAASTPSDAAYLKTHPGVLEFIVDYVSESLAVTSRGIADEVKCAAKTPQLDLTGLTAPISVWHGADDPMTSVADVHAWLGGRVADTRVFAGTGHFLPHKHWPEAIAWLADG
jgi:pimeloyl-ACP methyl ester carboxylesterase/DNA-binding CsgD family transcriptional regulator